MGRLRIARRNSLRFEVVLFRFCSVLRDELDHWLAYCRSPFRLIYLRKLLTANHSGSIGTGHSVRVVAVVGQSAPEASEREPVWTRLE